MASESELRDRFHDGTQPSGRIDVEAVLRRARARRRPRVIVAGAGSVLAIAAIAVPAALGSFSAPGGLTTLAGEGQYSAPVPESAIESDGDAAGGAADSAIGRAPAEKLNLCTAPVAETAPAENGLVLSVEPVTASAGDDGIPTIVTLTNTGPAAVSGTTGGRPAMTLSRGGVTLWHSNGPQTLIAVPVDLAPGESLRYPATFEPVECGVEDDSAETFRPGLPEVGPGVYQLSAAIDFTRNDGSFIDLVTGPAVRVTLE